MVRTVGVILLVAIVGGCGSSTSSVSVDADDLGGERPQDSNRPRDLNGDIDGDCTPATAFTCVASCASPTPTALICDDGHWECEHGVDSRQCADGGS